MSIKSRLIQLKQKKKEASENTREVKKSVSQDFLLEASRIVASVRAKLNEIDDWYSFEEDMQVDIIKKFLSEEIKDDKFLGINLDGLISKILSQINGYGVLDNIVTDPDIDKIFVNSTNYITVQKDGEKVKLPLKFDAENDLMSTVRRILSLAGMEYNSSECFYEGRLPDGILFSIVMPPVSKNGISLVMEKTNEKMLDFEHLVQADFMSYDTAKYLEKILEEKKNVLIAGSHDTGKKTLLTSMVVQLPSAARIFAAEDYKTSLAKLDNVISYDISDFIDDRKMLAKVFENIAKQSPDNIIVPVCHEKAAFEILKLANAGYKGIITTLYAPDKADALNRFLGKIIASSAGVDINILKKRILKAFDYVVFISDSKVAKTVEICEVISFDENEFKLKDVMLEKTLQKKSVTPRKTATKR